LSTLLAAGKDVLGKDIKIGKIGGACDSRMLGNTGKIPVIVYGPGEIKAAHALDEYIGIDDYLQSIKVLAVTIYRWSK